MAKPLVEQYEEALGADPASPVFAELAKVLLERGEWLRAIAVCRSGLVHNPKHVVGRVLWGKALIATGKAAEAMEQFDLAIAVDRQDPLAYNLIGEALLHRGLHRSALPILKKAAALQPDDLRIRQWLDQATRALNGTPQPLPQPEHTAVDVAPVAIPAARNGAAETVEMPRVESAAPPTVQVEPARSATPSVIVSDDPFAAAGGGAPAPAPAHFEATTVDLRALSHEQPLPSGPNARPAAPPTVEVAPGLTAETPAPLAAPTPEAAAPDTAAASAQQASAQPSSAPAAPPVAESLPAARAPEATVDTPPPAHVLAALESAALAPAPVQPKEESPRIDPFAAAGGGTEGGDVMPGMTGVFDSMSTREESKSTQAVPPTVVDLPPTPAPPEAEPPRAELPTPAPAEPPSDEPRPATLPLARALEETRANPEPEPSAPPPPEPTAPLAASRSVIVEPGLEARDLAMVSPLPGSRPEESTRPEPPPTRPSESTAESPPPPSPFRSPAIEGKPVPAPLPRPPEIPNARPLSANAVLPDLPPIPFGPTPSMELPKVQLSSQAASAIAQEYERELRAKLAARKQPESFWQVHGFTVALVALFAVVLAVGALIFRSTRRAQIDPEQTLARARTGLSRDTAASYRAALGALGDVAEIQPERAEVQALMAYAHAVLHAEHGRAQAEAEAATALLQKSGVAQGAPDLVFATRWLLAGDATTRGALASQPPQTLGPEAAEVVAREISESDPKRAGELLTQSLNARPDHVRSWLALGDLQLARLEAARAEESFAKARTVSERHPLALLGLAQARQLAQKPLAELEPELQQLDRESAELDDASLTRLDLVQARRAIDANQSAQATDRLERASRRVAPDATGLRLALADAHLAAGRPDAAAEAVATLVTAHPNDPAGWEALVRARVASGKAKEALVTLEKAPDDRRVHLVRGIAHHALGAWDAARNELLATRRDKNMPLEAALWLARVEVAAGRPEEARNALTALGARADSMPLGHLVKAELARATGDLANVVPELLLAQSDRRAWEPTLQLAREQLERGRLDDARASAVLLLQRNHVHPLIRATWAAIHAAVGAIDEARPQALGALELLPDAPEARYAAARVRLVSGDATEALRLTEPFDSWSPAFRRLGAQLRVAAGNAADTIRSLGKKARSDASTPCLLGELLLGLGDVRGAASTFELAMRTGQPCGEVGAALAHVRAGEGPPNAGTLERMAALSGDVKLPAMVRARAAHVSALAVPPGADRIAALDRALLLSNDEPFLLESRASEEATPAEALPSWRRAVAVAPNLLLAHVVLAERAAAEGRLDEARREGAEALRIHDAGPWADRVRALGAAAPTGTDDSANRGKRRRGGR